jgi:hypothetical protein
MAFPTTSVLDQFNRANGDPGANWTGPSFGDANKLSIFSNQIESAAAAFGAECWTASTFGPGIEVFADLASGISGGGSIRLIIIDSATSSTANGYYLVADSANNFNLSKSVSGSGSTIQALPSQAGIRRRPGRGRKSCLSSMRRLRTRLGS